MSSLDVCFPTNVGGMVINHVHDSEIACKALNLDRQHKYTTPLSYGQQAHALSRKHVMFVVYSYKGPITAFCPIKSAVPCLTFLPCIVYIFNHRGKSAVPRPAYEFLLQSLVKNCFNIP